MTRTERKACVGGRARASAVGVLAALAAGAGVVLGCGWNGYENSVRFNFGVTERERQRLPPLPFRLDAKDSRGAKPSDAEEDYYVGQYDEAAADQLWARADDAAEAGELARASALLREFAGRFGGDARANSAADRLDALSALDSGANPESVRAYLDARRSYDLRPPAAEAVEGAGVAPDAPQTSETPAAEDDSREAAGGVAPRARPLEELLREPPRDAALADNFAYLRAAVLYREAKLSEAADAFRGLAARFPRSEKREAALFMAARAELAGSAAYLGPGASATSEEACPDCRDAGWRAAREGFARVAREYPRGRLAGEARGWLAYLALRAGDTAGALSEYYRMLADESDAGANAEALMSLRLARGRADEAEMSLVEAELEDEPRAALAYAYHDIHNYTFGYYFTTPAPTGADSGGCQPERWRDEADELPCQRAEARNLARVARFAARMMSRHPGAGAGPAFAVRVAQANLELGETEAAHALARRALGGGATGAERAGALWVKAVAEYRRGEHGGARRTLAQIVSEFPGGDVEPAARRLLAIASEEAGDLEAALEQYLALGYDADVAYFVDVLLTPDRLAAFVAARPGHASRDELLYALGVRLLRAGRYREARSTLLSVRTTAPRPPDSGVDDYGYDRAPGDPKQRIRHYFYDADAVFMDGGVGADRRESGVYADWVARDLKTAEDLELLTDEAERGGTYEEKAEGLYQLASYLYEGGNLIFYNPAAWRGMRAEMLASLDETRYRSPGEAETVWRHAREHEALARAVEIYAEVARRYPGTRAARDSLYTAILCHSRLADFNAYWRRAYQELGLHAGARLVTYEDLRREYPRYRPPREGRWEPSTRTVGGRPAWPEPPAPKRLTGTERARKKIRRAEGLLVKGWALLGEVGGGRARRWSLVLACASALLLVWRATRRSRASLYELLRRAAARRAAPPAVVARPSSSYAAHEPYTAGARLRAAAGRVGRTLFEVALDERGRAAVALNLLTHGLLTALLWALLWALRAG